MTKHCRGCGETKPLDAFARCRSKKDGRLSRCRECRSRTTDRERQRAYNREYYRKNKAKLLDDCKQYRLANLDRERRNNRAWTEANRERANANKRRWRERNRDKANENTRKWARKNRERLAEKDRNYRRHHPEKGVARTRRYVERHPDKKREFDTARAARRRAAGGALSVRDWRETKAAALGLCTYCNERRPLTLDHIEPLAKGGGNDPENAAAACRRCNSSKNDTSLVVWLARRALERAA